MKSDNRNQNIETGMETEAQKEQMDRWREEYENVSVPKEARFRVQQGIRQAKQERTQRKATRWFRNTGTVMVASLAALMVIVNTNQAAAETIEQIPVLGSIARVVTFRDYKDQTNNFEAKVEVPKVTLDAAAGGSIDGEQQKNFELTNGEIDAYAQKFISEYEESLKASGGEGNYSLDSSYQVLRNDEKYLAIRIDTTVVMAGGTQYVKIYNIDRTTGKAVSLLDLFSGSQEALTAVSDNIKQQMKEQMAQDDSKTYFLDGEMPGTDFEGLTGNESYYLNDNGDVVIWFNEYDVAPGSMGAVEFTIPASLVSGYLHN